MAFSSYQFLFLFLPLVLIVNRFLSLKLSNIFLLAASLLFYSLGEGILVFILIGSITWNFVLGLIIANSRNTAYSKVMVGLGVGGNMLILTIWKFPHFIPWRLFLGENGMISIPIALGISFFTFQGISYLIDVYRGLHPPERNLLTLGLYISLFPQLIAGPIVKYNEIVTYLTNRSLHLDQTFLGAQKFLRGLAKKVIIADSLALIADTAFTTEVMALPTAIAWLGVLTYSLQIYYDFSGYSDMAIGLCLIMGFKIPENFMHPYCSTSIREFWRRWHISLSTWFKSYLYIPLGGNRKGSGRTYLNLIIVFFLTGLWHGPHTNFVIWGMLHGLFMIIERRFPFVFEKLPRGLLHLYTLLVIAVTWVFFRAGTFTEALGYLQALFTFDQQGDWKTLLYFTPYHAFILFIGILFAMPIRKVSYEKLTIGISGSTVQLTMTSVTYLLLAGLCFMELSISSYSPFIYFRF